MKYRLSFLLLFLVAFYGCNNDVLHPADYVNWLKDESNGLKLVRHIGRYDFELQYKTPEFVALQNLRKTTVDEGEVAELKKRYEDIEQYTFRISSSNQEDLLDENAADDQQYGQRLEYFVSYAQDDIYMIVNSDTVECAVYNYERSYGLSPEVTITVGFAKKLLPENSDRSFVFDDHILGTGPVLLTISKKDLSQLPELSYEK